MSTNPYEFLERYPELFNEFRQILVSSANITEDRRNVLDKIELLCETRILELWNEKDSKEFSIVCSTYYTVKTLVGLKHDTIEDIMQNIKTILIGYLGGKTGLVKGFIEQYWDEIERVCYDFDKWEEKITCFIYKTIAVLIKGKDYSSLDVTECLQTIKLLQLHFESSYLHDKERHFTNTENTCLYYFARCLELVIEHFYHRRNKTEFKSSLAYYIDKIKIYAYDSNDYYMFTLTYYFEEFVIQFMKDNYIQEIPTKSE